MNVNIGTVDRRVRVVVGIVILGVLGVYYQSWWGLIGLLPILTAWIRFCPAYVPLKISTCETDTKEPPIPPGGPKPA